MSLAAVMAAVAVGFPLPSPMPVVHDQGCPTEPLWSCYVPGGGVWLSTPLGRGHELGHAYSYLDLAPGERAAIVRRTLWRDWHEDAFADLYSGCADGLDPGDPSIRAEGVYRGVRAARVPGLCRLIARAAGPGETGP